jgi:hypothetical protein
MEWRDAVNLTGIEISRIGSNVQRSGRSPNDGRSVDDRTL